MTTIEQIVGGVRSLLSAGLGNEVSMLATAYVPGSPTITLAHQKRVGSGSVLSVGLSTFVAATTSATEEVAVVPGIDGSPDESSPTGTIVHLSPRHTTWQVYREVSSTIRELTSPVHGLHGVTTESFVADPTYQTYVLAATPLRVLRVRFLVPGSPDDWNDMAWRYRRDLPGGPTIEAITPAPGGSTVQVVYAVEFSEPTGLDNTLESLSIPDSYERLITVGAAKNLALATESRRSQPYSQGDPRRADEVPLSGNAMVYDRLRAQFRDLVAMERTRLIQQYPYRSGLERYRAVTM